jgi:hypothetical protein
MVSLEELHQLSDSCHQGCYSAVGGCVLILLTSATNLEVQGLLLGAAVGPDLLGPEL